MLAQLASSSSRLCLSSYQAQAADFADQAIKLKVFFCFVNLAAMLFFIKKQEKLRIAKLS
jgi:hypothetical protein